MLLLALNSATTLTEITLIKDEQTLFEKSWPSQKDEAEKILPAIEQAFQKSKTTIGELDAIFIINGPGPFSGLRIGVTIANALAFSKKIPIFSCDTFEILRHKVTLQKRKNTALMISAGGSHFALLLPNKKKPLQYDSDELVDFLKKQKASLTLYADLQPSQWEKISPALQKLKKIDLQNPKDLLSFSEAVKEIFEKKSSRPQKIAAPLYFEKPHITKSKKQIFN